MELPSSKKRRYIILVNACRWLLALALMLSGFLKAVDPVGGMYKLQEYAAAFSVSGITDDALLAIAVVQAAVEFLIGLFLFAGVYRCFIPFMALLMMSLFTPFTLYLWVSGTVSDCGCFGETVLMSNGMTFAKNVLLLALSIVAFAKRSLFICNVNKKIRWVLVISSLVYIFSMQAVALLHLPLNDSGSYAVGNNLRSMVQYTPGEYRYMSVYEKDGEEIVLPIDTIPGDEWAFVRTYSEELQAGVEPEIGNFSIVDWEYDIEMSDELLADTGFVCLVVIEDVDKASVTHIDRINDLYDYCVANGMRFCAVSSSGEDAVKLWTKRTGAEYSLYWADVPMLRSVIHANPGLVLLNDGVIVGKWAIADISDVEVLESADALTPDVVGPPATGARRWPFWLLLLLGGGVFVVLSNMLVVRHDRRREKRTARGAAAGGATVTAADDKVIVDETSDTN